MKYYRLFPTLFLVSVGSVVALDATNKEEESSSRSSGLAKTVLVIEDNSVTRGIYEKIISKYGIKVDTVENGLEGLDYLFNRNLDLDLDLDPDLIFLDWEMPLINGGNFLQIFHHRTIPIIMISSSTEKNQKGLKLGAKSAIKKGDCGQILGLLQKYGLVANS